LWFRAHPLEDCSPPPDLIVIDALTVPISERSRAIR
jgi:hypothetical protein